MRRLGDILELKDADGALASRARAQSVSSFTIASSTSARFFARGVYSGGAVGWLSEVIGS